MTPLRILFCSPCIPNNTGATMRLAAITGAELHMARPLGFDLDDAKLRRAGVDYRDKAVTFVHDSLEDAYAALLPARVFAFTAHATVAHSDIAYRPGDVLLFGPEPTLPPLLADARSPSASGSRCGRQPLAQPRQRRRHRTTRRASWATRRRHALRRLDIAHGVPYG